VNTPPQSALPPHAAASLQKNAARTAAKTHTLHKIRHEVQVVASNPKLEFTAANHLKIGASAALYRVSNPMLEFTAANPLPVSVPSAAI
jgi:hypothetical protein